MSLYGLDEDIEKLLNPETFQEGFSAKDFIEKLSENILNSTDEFVVDGARALDPKPYIRNFEAVLNELRRLEVSAGTEERNAAQDMYQIEISHSKSMVNLGGLINSTMSEFSGLEELVNDIVSATSSLTDKLEVLSGQYEQTVSSTFLIKTYLSFVRKGNSSDLSRLWEGGLPADRRKCVSVVRQLQGLSRRIGNSDDKLIKPHEEIDKFAESIETDLLQEFDNAYISADMAAMRESASILTDFNGGGSVVQVFVNQHDFFIVQEKLVDTSRMNDDAMWVKMKDPQSDTIEFETLVQELMDEIKNGVASETEIITRVFPNPVMVFKVFLQRIFAQRIQQQLEAYFQVAENISTLAYVRVLHISYNRVGALVKAFKEWFNQLALDNDGELASLLDQNFADIFLPYIDNGRYFESEKKNLQEIISSALQKFSDAHKHSSNQRDQRLLGRFSTSNDGDQTEISDSINGSPTLGAPEKSHEKGRIGQFMRAVRLERTNSSGNGNNSSTRPNSQPDYNSSRASAEIDIGDLEIRYDNIQLILGAFAESVSRDLELANSNNVKHDAQELVRLLIDTVGHNHIDVALEEALAACSDDQRSNITLKYLKVIPPVNGSIKLIAAFVKNILFSMARGSDSVQAHMVTSLNNYVSSAEETMNAIVSNTIDLIITKINSILNKQKKKDFIPRSDERTDVTTSVCDEVIQLLGGVYGISLESLDGANLELFLREIGFGLREALKMHLKKFSISPSGGLILIR
ncbi:Sec10p [Sugiyamaella lignohabitans]|uniref:Sec10p n=1 Tax=Sugiyamaella lignohabitans TaxID=796027 RepID=A0A167FM75_9ASCO|nr:Sec10p [Sugiyamaella lignohabitans]ANB15472.1 Sec10p [Sugiyamaella lignohabitans]